MIKKYKRKIKSHELFIVENQKFMMILSNYNFLYISNFQHLKSYDKLFMDIFKKLIQIFTDIIKNMQIKRKLIRKN